MTSPRRAPQLASLIDVTPTTLALAGLPSSAYEGRSLLAPSPPRVARFSTEQGVHRVGLRDARWKIIADADGGRIEVFDLARDTGEREGLSDGTGAVAEKYRACLGLD